MTTAAVAQIPEARRSDAGAYAIEIVGMSTAYGETPAVRNLSMHVPHGSIYGLVGPSGAGKTTTIRTVATLQRPDAGTVLVDGIDVLLDPAEARGRIGYLPDFSGVYDDLTVSEYLDFYGGIYQIPARRRRRLMDELLELAGLAEHRTKPVRSLSRGMRQQLGLARCLIHDPKILLLDEPAAGMDPRMRVELRDILQELSRFQKTILISSHLLSELAEVCTHLGIMRAGELLAEGPMDEIGSMISPEPHLHLHLLDRRNRDEAGRLLESHPACGEIEVEGESELRTRFTGTKRDLTDIVGQLSTAGVQVTELVLEQRTLEEIFLLVTEMEAAT